MAYKLISPFVFDCAVCPTRCDGKSKRTYDFESDLALSEKYEQLIIAIINSTQKYNAGKCTDPGYPDIAIYWPDGQLRSYVEVKVQRRAFMKVKRNYQKQILHHLKQ